MRKFLLLIWLIWALGATPAAAQRALRGLPEVSRQCRQLARKRKPPRRPLVVRQRKAQSVAKRAGSVPTKAAASAPTSPPAVPAAEEKIYLAGLETDAPRAPIRPTPSPPPPPPPPLPPPVSDKHARIREQVQAQLKTGEPPVVESLYFVTSQDEFAFMDMEPFLMAAEYALAGKMLLVEGHTDDRGNDEFNLQLSMKRVQRIQSLMMDMGVPADRISVIGYGETAPTYDNRTPEGRQKNRRVDFKIF